MKTTTKSFLETGVHLGHSPSHWHPKIVKHIYTEKLLNYDLSNNIIFRTYLSAYYYVI